MNSKYDITIIIPMFNVSTYIRQCASSLFSQSQVHVQFIFIDDGSTDNGAELLTNLIEQNFFHLKDDIIIIKLESNRGVANARNVGISHALGEYIGFVDSDDWIEMSMFQELYHRAIDSHADIVGCNFIHEYPNESKYCYQKFTSNKYEYLRRLINGEIFPSLWSEIVRQDIYVNNGIRFEKGLNMGEDLLVNVQLVLYSNKISFLNQALYHYRHTDNSLCANKSLQSIESDVKVASLISEIFVKKGLYEQYKNELNYRKFFSKLPYWTFKNFRNVHLWRNLYSESNKFLFSFRQLDWKMKIEYWLALHRMTILADFFVFCLNFRHKIINKLF